MTTAPAYDLLLTGGNILDPAQGIDGRRDIAFKDGLVAEVSERIDAAKAGNSVDVTGKLITPGLIDLHTHVYSGVNANGVDPDIGGVRAAVTTMVSTAELVALLLAIPTAALEHVENRTGMLDRHDVIELVVGLVVRQTFPMKSIDRVSVEHQ